MKKYYCLIFTLSVFVMKNYAQGFKAGSIYAKWLYGYTYEIKLETYTQISLVVDHCEDSLCFGDGTSAVVLRSNGPIGGCAPAHEGVAITPTIKLNEYITTHTYPGPGNYIICYESRNRNQGINNIPNSINTRSSFNTYLQIPVFSPSKNSSPTFSNSPIPTGCVDSILTYNQLAQDADNDSLSFLLIACKESANPLPGFVFPTPGTFSINPVNGIMLWDKPNITGDYNVVIKTEEWRKDDDGNYFLVGYTEREVQIEINNCATSVKTEAKKAEIETYPNPASDNIKITLKDDINSDISLIITDISGKIVEERMLILGDAINKEFLVDISNISSGMYFMLLKSNSSRIAFKFIKQ